MQEMKYLKLAALCAALCGPALAHAALVTNANLSTNVIFGSGNINGGFTIATSGGSGGLEVGLRAKVRGATPTNDDPGTNVYRHAAGESTPGNARWNFDWSINTGTLKISDYLYRLDIDYNAGVGTAFQSFDLINSVNPNPLAGGLPLWDHSFGTNATAQSAGIEATGATLAQALANYELLESSNNLVQNSWNLGFFDNASFPFNASADGQYTIRLAVVSANGEELVRSQIEVIVGDGATNAVPEPGTLALAGLALAGLGLARRRKA